MRQLVVLTLVSTILVAPAVRGEPAPGPGPAAPIRAAIARVRFDDQAATKWHLVQPPRGNSTATKASAAVAVGFLGLLGGGWLGAALQPNCGCQDQGLAGALIGMPIGAVVGAIVGWKLASP